MKVRDIMSRPVRTVDMDRTVLELDRIFEKLEFHHVVVVDRGRPIGVVSDRDVLRSVSPFVGTMSERAQDEQLLKRRAHQIMTRPPITIGPDEPVAAAGRLMREQRVSCLVVVEPASASGDPERLVGIITLRDIADWAVEELESRAAA